MAQGDFLCALCTLCISLREILLTAAVILKPFIADKTADEQRGGSQVKDTSVK